MARETFADLHEAGRLLAGALGRWADRTDTVVIAIPRAGVVVGYEVAVALGAPLEVHVVHEVLDPRSGAVLGAVGAGGSRALDRGTARFLGVREGDLKRWFASETAEVARLERFYRGQLPSLDLDGRTAIVVDRGFGHCWPMMTAAADLRSRHPAHVVFAAPVGRREVADELRLFADQVVVPRRPEPFYSVRAWYDDEREPTDDELRELVHLRSPHRRPSMAPWAAQIMRLAA